MTVKEYFDDILGRITLSLDDDELQLIKDKHRALRKELWERLPLVDDFLTGSYKRHTIIKPQGDEKFDVDIFVAFDGDDYEETELSELRQSVINALHDIKESCPELGITEINEEQKRSVGVEFGNNFQIDIVPAVQIEKDVRYKIFDRKTLEAVVSNPKLHGKLLTEANENSGEMLVPLIRILKAWKREKCDYVKSFHLELLAVEIFSEAAIESYSQGLTTFLESAEAYLKEPCLKDPANDEMFVDEYLDTDNARDELLKLIVTEKTVAETALVAEKGGDESAAIVEWEKIMADSEASTAKAVRVGQFYKTAGGVVVKTNPTTNDEGTKIDSPKSWS